VNVVIVRQEIVWQFYCPECGYLIMYISSSAPKMGKQLNCRRCGCKVYVGSKTKRMYDYVGSKTKRIHDACTD
jgi:predicted RNA-binding Zn-ribbon protein involved in translation (DUF1610 family)